MDTSQKFTKEDKEGIEILLNVDLYAERLTDWEIQFLENIKEQETLSLRQRQVLDEVFIKLN